VEAVKRLSVNGKIAVFGNLKLRDEVICNAPDAIRSGLRVKAGSSPP
jgi:hypothetical protein